MTSNDRSIELITQLLKQLESLGDHEPALHKIYLYMMYAIKYKIAKVVIGQSLYLSSVMPTLGAAYAQYEHTSDTPSLRMIAKHFRDKAAIVSSVFKHSWRLLPVGYLFINCDYMSAAKKGAANMYVPCLRRIYMMVEYILYVLGMTSNNDTIELLAIGGPAEICANRASSTRLRANDHRVKVVICGQPARLIRLTCNLDCVGIVESYSVFNP